MYALTTMSLNIVFLSESFSTLVKTWYGTFAFSCNSTLHNLNGVLIQIGPEMC